MLKSEGERNEKKEKVQRGWEEKGKWVRAYAY